MKTPITYYGGKQMLVSTILPLIPDHHIYTETFCGGAAIYFAKRPSPVEVINDINQELINFYRVLKNKREDLVAFIEETLHSRRMHKDAYVIYTNPHLFSDVKRAWALWTLSKQGFSGQLSNSWGYDVQGKSMGTKIDNAKRSLTIEFQKRIEKTTIECGDALAVIERFDRENSFHYVDTPYFNSDCGHYGGYSQEDFEQCLKVLEKVKGKFLLSNYPSDILDQYIEKNGWFVVDHEFKVAVTAATNKTKIERLVANYDITKSNIHQNELF